MVTVSVSLSSVFFSFLFWGLSFRCGLGLRLGDFGGEQSW